MAVGGTQALTWHPPPPPRKMSKHVDEVQPTLGPVAPKAPDFVKPIVGVRISLSLLVCILKMVGFLWGIPICMQNLKIFLTLTSPIQPPRPGCCDQTPQGGETMR